VVTMKKPCLCNVFLMPRNYASICSNDHNLWLLNTVNNV
jgi:hypothetical protein